MVEFLFGLTMILFGAIAHHEHMGKEVEAPKEEIIFE